MAKTNTFTAHMDAVSHGEVTKTNVIGMRKAINARERRDAGCSVSSTCPDVPHHAIDAALDMLGHGNVRVTGELHDSGLAQLQSKRYRKQLASVAEIVADIKEFRLMGFEMIGTRIAQATPIYRAIDSKGQGFNFINLPWQSGGNGPELI